MSNDNAPQDKTLTQMVVLGVCLGIGSILLAAFLQTNFGT